MPYTTADVMEMTGLSRERIAKAGKEFGLSKFGHSYVWEEADVERLKSRMGKVGNPNFSNGNNPRARKGPRK